MTDLSPETRSLIERAREQQGPSDEARNRMRGRLAATVGVAFGLPLGAGLVRAALAKLTAASIATKVIVASAIVASSVVAVHTLQRPTATAPAALSRQPTPPTRAAAARPAARPTSTAADDSGASSIAVADDAGLPSLVERPRPRPSLVEREASLIARADRALRDGQPAAALVLVEEHRAQFALGQLSHERDALEVIALCEIGRPLRAQQAMARFDPRSLAPSLQRRLASSCAAARGTSLAPESDAGPSGEGR